VVFVYEYRFHRDDARAWLYKADIYGKFSHSKLSSCSGSPSLACKKVQYNNPYKNTFILVLQCHTELSFTFAAIYVIIVIETVCRIKNNAAVN